MNTTQKENVDPRYKKMILSAMEYHFPQARILLFGSRARGTHSPGSDIDIAVDAGTRIPFGELDRARITLNNLPFLLKVDLVDMNSIPVELKNLILEKGILWKS